MKSSAEKTRIVIADDHDVLRFGLRTLLEKEPDFEIVGEAIDGKSVLRILERGNCDLLILDLSMPEMDGLAVLAEIRKRNVEVRVLIFSMHRERELFRAALAAGVSGYMLKDDDLAKIPNALRDIRAGRKFFSPDLTTLLVEDYARIQDDVGLKVLTRRELEILKKVASGLTNNEIGEELGISPRTVQTHRTNLMAKLDLKNTADLVRLAVSRGLV